MLAQFCYLHTVNSEVFCCVWHSAVTYAQFTVKGSAVFGTVLLLAHRLQRIVMDFLGQACYLLTVYNEVFCCVGTVLLLAHC
jgi:hypothetical protein